MAPCNCHSATLSSSNIKPKSPAQQATTKTKNLHIKRLIALCDGTGQASDQGESNIPTNVTRLARALDTSLKGYDTSGGDEYEIPQLVFYRSGVGTKATTKLANSTASAFGLGVDQGFLEAYVFFSNNFECGDKLYLFGFSRGAFTARALASLICNVGLLCKDSLHYLPLIYGRYKAWLDVERPHPDDEKAKEKYEANKAVKEWDDILNTRSPEYVVHQNVDIEILGLWDTVGSVGSPTTFVNTAIGTVVPSADNGSYGYHDTKFPIVDPTGRWRARILQAYQALALDESRTPFTPTLLYYNQDDLDREKQKLTPDGVPFNPKFKQTWFPGVHTDIGGGYERAFGDISDIALGWMIDVCSESLQFRDYDWILKELRNKSVKGIDPLLPDKDAVVPPDRPWALSETHDEYHTAAFIAAGWLTRTPGQYFVNMKGRYRTHESMHVSVRRRMMKNDVLNKPWQPDALAGFKLEKVEGNWSWVRYVDLGRGPGKEYKVTLWESGKTLGKEGDEAPPPAPEVRPEPVPVIGTGGRIRQRVRLPDEFSKQLLTAEDRAALRDDAVTQAIKTSEPVGTARTLVNAAGNTIASAVTAPFKLLGKLF